MADSEKNLNSKRNVLKGYKMKRIRLVICIAILITIVACQQGVKKTPAENTQASGAQVTTSTDTGDATVDSVGNDLNNVNNDEKDLSTNNLSDVDSGLQDVQNI